MRKRISTALATCNGAKYIRAQIESITSQTLPVDEIIISDACSSDGTISIASSALAENNYSGRLEIVENEIQLYPTDNFAIAVRNTTGDYIFLCDQDDVWLPNKVEKFVDCFEKGYHVCISNFSVCDADLNKKYSYLPSASGTLRDRRSHMHGCASAFTKEFKEIYLPIESVAKDEIWFDQWLSQLSESMSLRYIIMQDLHLWRRHDSAWSGMEKTTPDPVVRKRFRRRWGSVKDQLNAIDWQLKANGHVADRIARNNIYLSVQLGVDVSGAQQALDRENRFLLSRRRYLLNRWLRPMLIAKNVLTGGYDKFGGYRSAVIDLIR